MTHHPFRFGVVVAQARTAQEWVDKARRVEALGYSILLMPDTIEHSLSPMPALTAAAAATQSLRVGTYVTANDFRSPVLLAKEAATVDFLSGGRFELGIGAGRPGAAGDNRMLGIPFDSGGTRVERLAESVGIIKALLEGLRAGSTGRHYAVADAQIFPKPVQQPRPPLLIAGSGKQMLGLAAREADIVALGVRPDETEAAVGEKIGWLREAAGERFANLEININMVAIGQHVPEWLLARMGLTLEQLTRSDAISALLGTTAEMCERLLARREALGISYINVSDELMEAFSPVVEQLAGH
jgi:probable F420-dependent oxidoreductase